MDLRQPYGSWTALLGLESMGISSRQPVAHIFEQTWMAALQCSGKRFRLHQLQLELRHLPH